MRMRQDIAEIEEAFYEEAVADREGREGLYRAAERRARGRHAEKPLKRGSLRFGRVLLTLIATAARVTSVLVQAVYWVMT